MVQFPLTCMRVKRWGHSLCLILPTNFREDLNLHEGDIVAVRIKPPYAHLCVWPMSRLAPLGEVDVRELPPTQPFKLPSKTTEK